MLSELAFIPRPQKPLDKGAKYWLHGKKRWNDGKKKSSMFQQE